MIRRGYRQPGWDSFILCLQGRPIGYLQCFDLALDTGRTFPLERRATRGIDLFIGEPAYLGQGHGAAFLRLAAEWLLAQPGVRRVIGDPEPANRRSRRAFEKAGFRDSGERTVPGGSVRLMVLEEPARIARRRQTNA